MRRRDARGHVRRQHGPLPAVLVATALSAVLAVVAPWGAGASSTADPAQGSASSASGAERELPDARTATSRTYLDDDGRMRTRLYAHRVNFRDSDGDWQKIDGRLVPSTEPGVAFANAANSFRAELPAQLTEPVRVESDGEWIEQSLVDAGGDAAGSDGQVVYRDALEDASVRYRALPDGLKEDVILETASAPRRFAYGVRVSDGLNARQEDDQTVVFESAEGEIVFAMAAPLMVDDAGAMSDELNLTLVEAAGAIQVELVPNRAGLSAEERAFPVTVDPTIHTNGRTTRYYGADQECTIAGGSYASTSMCGSDPMWFGWGGPEAWRALVKFNVAAAVPKGSVILDAHLGGLVEQQTHSGQSSIEVRRITRSWTSAATWNSYDGTNAWTTPGGNASAKVDEESVPSYGLDWYIWDDLRDTVDGWINGGVGNYGLMLRAATESSAGPVNVFGMATTQGDPTAQKWPYMDIHHEPRTGALGSYTLLDQQLSDRMQVGVNVANGNLLLQTSDLTIAGRAGHGLSFGRVYNTSARWSTDMSDRWRTSTGRGICLRRYQNGDIALDGPTGWTLLFDRQADGSYKAPPGVEAKLVSDGSNGMKLTWNRSGEKMWFNSWDVLRRHEDRNGNAIVFNYNATTKDRLESITDSQGRTITVARDSATGHIGSVTDPTGRSWLYGYDSSGDLSSVTDPEGKITGYEYDAQHRLTAIVDPRGNRTELTYLAHATSWRVGTLKRVVDGTTANDVKWTFRYYTPSSTTAGASCDASLHMLKTVVTDPRGNLTTHCSNRDGQVTRTVDANGRPTKTSYTAAANVQDFTDGVGTANEALSTLGYDDQGSDPTNNLTSIDQPAGEKGTIDYWPNDTSDPLARYRAKTVTDAEGDTESYGYDTRGNLTSVKDSETSPLNQATLDRNTDGTLDLATDGRGNATDYGYNTIGNLTSVTPPTLDANTGIQLGVTVLTYDSLSRTKRVTQGAKWRENTYDKLDRLKRVDFSDGSYFTYTYDDNGNLIERTDSMGPNTSAYTYDELNRRETETLAGQTTSHTYDKLGNLETLTNGGGTTTYSYDAVNRPQSIADGVTATIDYDDPGARRAEILTFPSGTTQRTETDGSGRTMKIEARDSTGTAISRLSYGYGYTGSGGTTVQGSRRRWVTELNGEVTRYVYNDPVGRLTRAYTKDSSGATIID